MMEDAGDPGATGHPWFGRLRLRQKATADTIREMLRAEIQDTGWPYQNQLPAAPIVLPRASYAELFRAASALVDLLRRVALEGGPTTEARLAAHRMPEHEGRLFVRDQFLEERYADCVVRPDVVIGPDGPQFLEFNVSSAVGGPLTVHCRMEAWRKLYADDAGRIPFTYHDPFAVRADMFRGIAAELAVAPRVALVGRVGVAEAQSRYFQLEADHYNSQGLTTRYFDPDELYKAWDCAPHLRYPLGLRIFTVGDFVRYGVDTRPVQEALDHDCLLVTTQTSTFLHSKLTMGRLSEGRPWMTSAERRLVDKYLPWTRCVADGKTHRDGAEIDLVAFVLDNRESLVLKTALGESGHEVVLGREASPAAWESAVAQAIATGTSVVQNFVAPRTCRLGVLTDGSAESYDVDIAPVFGPLLFGGRPAGVFTRFFGDGAAGIVSIAGRHRTCSDNAVVAV